MLNQDLSTYNITTNPTLREVNNHQPAGPDDVMAVGHGIDQGADIAVVASRPTSPNTETGSFSGKWTLVITCLGCVVGTGNIWRFPRIVATNGGEEGALVFLLVWVLFLFAWSIPMLILEYTLGRKTERAVLGSFHVMGNPWSLWCGAWIVMVSFLISCYYAVVLGWCIYYSFYFIAHDLPTTHAQGKDIFTDFTTGSYWSLLTTGGALLVAGLSVVKGVKTIEKVSLVLVPMLFIIVIFTFIWSITRSYAGVGLSYLFTPDWSTFKNPRLWIDALSQNAFDTGAGSGLLVSYATFMSNYGVVRYSHIIPAANNLVSLISGMTLFGSVFSTMIISRGSITNAEILEVLEDSGNGNTGITFIWLPVLFETAGVLGHIVTVLFFFCLAFAGLTSLIANMELFTHTLTDLGLRRALAMPLVVMAAFVVGLGSALNLDVLTNQDFVWGFGLVVNGMMFASLIIGYGVNRYVDEVNQYIPRDHVAAGNYSDWRLRGVWGYFIKFLAIPLGLLLIVWWVVEIITDDNKDDKEWYEVGVDTFMTTVLEWLVLLILLWTANMIYYVVKYRRPNDVGENQALLEDPTTNDDQGQQTAGGTQSRRGSREAGRAQRAVWEKSHETKVKTFF